MGFLDRNKVLCFRIVLVGVIAKAVSKWVVVVYNIVEGTFLYRMTGFGNTKSSALLVDGDVFFFYQIYFESRGKKRQIKEMIIVFSFRSLVTGT